MGNSIDVVVSEFFNDTALPAAVSFCCAMAKILSKSVLRDVIENGPDEGKSVVLAMGI